MMSCGFNVFCALCLLSVVISIDPVEDESIIVSTRATAYIDVRSLDDPVSPLDVVDVIGARAAVAMLSREQTEKRDGEFRETMQMIRIRDALIRSGEVESMMLDEDQRMHYIVSGVLPTAKEMMDTGACVMRPLTGNQTLTVSYRDLLYHLESMSANTGHCTTVNSTMHAAMIAMYVMGHGHKSKLFMDDYTTLSSFRCLLNVSMVGLRGRMIDYKRAFGFHVYPVLEERMNKNRLTKSDWNFVFTRLLNIGNETWACGLDYRVVEMARAMMSTVGECMGQKRIVEFVPYFELKRNRALLNLAKMRLATASSQKEHDKARYDLATITERIQYWWGVVRPEWKMDPINTDEYWKGRKIDSYIKKLKNGKQLDLDAMKTTTSPSIHDPRMLRK